MKTRVWFFYKDKLETPYNSYVTVHQTSSDDLDFIPRVGEYVECLDEVSGFVAHVQHCVGNSLPRFKAVINIYLVKTKPEIEGFLQ